MDYPQSPSGALIDKAPSSDAALISLNILRCHAPAKLEKPHNVYVLTELTRSGIGYYCRVFVPGLVLGAPSIVELTGAIANATAHPHKARGACLWLSFKGTYDIYAPIELMGRALGLEAELRSSAYNVKPL